MPQFTKKTCEQVGINFELRLVGEARAGLDGEGVGIDVEEAILEVCPRSCLAGRDIWARTDAVGQRGPGRRRDHGLLPYLWGPTGAFVFQTARGCTLSACRTSTSNQCSLRSRTSRA